jgi:hypothetical protein
MEVTYYKWLNPDRTTTYQGVKWPKRVGVWTPDKTPVLCQSGWHLATHQGIGEHARVGAVLWTAEGRGESSDQDDKIAFTSARLVSEVGTLTHETAVLWAAECAKRVLTIYEDKYRDDKRPREAIAAAVKWAKNPTEKNRVAAYHAASSSAYAAADAADLDAANVASSSAYAAADAADLDAANVAYAAANAAAYAASANAANAADANAAYAVYAHAEARTVERLWQSNRLVALISGTTGATGKATK